MRPVAIQSLAKMTDDVSKCNIWEKGKTFCILNYAISKNDESICELLPIIENYDGKADAILSPYRDTRDNCYFQFALSNKDISLCDGSGVYLSRCRNRVAVESKNLDLCNYEDIDTQHCIYLIARKTKNMDICSKIDQNVTWFNSCYYDFARDLSNLSICDKYVTEVYKRPSHWSDPGYSHWALCYKLVIADVFDDKEMCLIINESKAEESCISRIDRNRNINQFWKEHKEQRGVE